MSKSEHMAKYERAGKIAAATSLAVGIGSTMLTGCGATSSGAPAAPNIASFVRTVNSLPFKPDPSDQNFSPFKSTAVLPNGQEVVFESRHNGVNDTTIELSVYPAGTNIDKADPVPEEEYLFYYNAEYVAGSIYPQGLPESITASYNQITDPTYATSFNAPDLPYKYYEINTGDYTTQSYNQQNTINDVVNKSVAIHTIGAIENQFLAVANATINHQNLPVLPEIQS